MKKLILITIALFSFIYNSSAQVIPNPDMEDWFTINGYDSLGSWISSNELYFLADEYSFIISFGITQTNHPSTVIKSSPGYSGSYAVEVRNVVDTLITYNFLDGSVSSKQAFDTAAGFISSASGVGDNVAEGFPINSRPTALTGHYKFNQGGSGISPDIDTAFIAIGFTKWNSANNAHDSIGGGAIFITNSVSTFTSFTVPIYYFNGTVPDTAEVLIASSIAQKSFPNTSITIDNLALSGVASVKIPLFSGPQPTIFPNPAVEEINIRNIPEEVAYIEVKNTKGQIVKTIKSEGEITSFNVKDLQPGMYLYLLKGSDDVVLYSNKFSISR